MGGMEIDMKQTLPRLWGNDALRARFGNDILARRLSHAYILEGKYGLGKHTLALQLAAAQSCLAKDDEHAPLPCGTCKNCKKILEGKSPDVTIIGREKGKVQITVDAVRHLRTDVLTAPNDLDTKVYIIEDAHAMNQQAQNALLLTLEEPPAYVLFLLLCEDASNLLETIRSRAPIYRLQSLPLDTVRQYVTQHTPPGITLPPEDKLEQLLMAADGSIGKALDLLSPKQSAPILEARQAAMELLDAAPDKGERVIRALLPYGIRKEDGRAELRRDEVAYKLETLLRALRDLIAVHRCDPATVPLCFFTDRDTAIDYSLRFGMQDLLRLLDAVDTALESISQRNANLRIAICEMAVRAGIL